VGLGRTGWFDRLLHRVEMKRVASILSGKSIDSLVLSIEYFNRPWDWGTKWII